ncbi:hypothetical protein [Rhizobium sp. FKL33]|uniref:hypothetical protein n=1 Tax=Rhizobium sp. FKL33 TaxID=2562307 RepID=UPI0010BFF614|nr:hypothetical protein [Rhizobium sp. FKL33]
MNPSELLAPSSSVLILPGHVHQTCLAEQLVVATGVMQRMRRLRQMGLAYFEYPLAEHSRLVHSLGTAYWATRMLRGLEMSSGELLRANQKMLRAMGVALGPTVSLELIVRLYALVHDAGLPPLGHTLRIQLERLEPNAFEKCFQLSVRRICQDLDGTTASKAKIACLKFHLALAEAAAFAPRLLDQNASRTGLLFNDIIGEAEFNKMLPVLMFVHDLVHGVCAADLFDWSARDLAAIGGHPVNVDLLLLSGAVLRAEKGSPEYPERVPSTFPVYRYGIDCRDNGGSGKRALYQLTSLYRARLEVILFGSYSIKKRAADAMLDKALRVLEEEGSELNIFGAYSELTCLGDDDFLSNVENQPACRNIMSQLTTGKLFQAAFEMRIPDNFKIFEGSHDSADEARARSRLEQKIADMSGIPAEDIILSVLPESMQGKEPTTLVAVDENGWQKLADFARNSGSVADMAHSIHEYRAERRLTVLLRAELNYDQAWFAGQCKELFQSSASGLMS